nr:zinc finger, CCHC-type [Tanacetum cinerariifolium]
MRFNESGEYKKTFISSGVGTRSVQVAGSHEVQTQALIDYHLARDREQHSARELYRYREDNNEAAFVAGLKEDMDARSDMYVFSNDCRKSSDDSVGYY